MVVGVSFSNATLWVIDNNYNVPQSVPSDMYIFTGRNVADKLQALFSEVEE